MQSLKHMGAALALGAVLAACGGNAPTQAPDGGNGGNGGTGGQPTANAQPTDDTSGNGGNGGADFTYGKVTFQVSGPITKSAEYGFVPAASVFGGGQGSSLSFTGDAANGTSLLSILQGDDGKVVISWAAPEGTVPAAECTTTDWNIGAGSGSGKFDCTAAFTIMASGASVNGGEIKGEFTAHS